MHLNKNHTFSRRALAMLLTLTLCLSLVPSAFAAQQNSYHDPAEHWMQASNRTNELDVNSVVTRETFKCGECGKVTSFEVFRVPEYTRNGQTALSRNVKYSDGTMMDGVGKGDCMDGVPGKTPIIPAIIIPRQSAKPAAVSTQTSRSLITATSKMFTGCLTAPRNLHRSWRKP